MTDREEGEVDDFEAAFKAACQMRIVIIPDGCPKCGSRDKVVDVAMHSIYRWACAQCGHAGSTYEQKEQR